jgi:glycosyltransferase involved in cell wall biosynthesis
MSEKSNYIVFLCSYLNVPGGYEKAVITAANLFTEKGNRVTIVILDKAKGLFYTLHPSVQIIQQPLSLGITQEGNIVSRKIQMLSDVLKLRKIIGQLQPDFIIAAEYPFAVAAILSGAGKKAKVVSWEHHHHGAQAKNYFWEKATQYAYRRLDAIVCLNEDEKNHYLSFNKQACVIPNFIEQPKNSFAQSAETASPEILSVTRFNHIKGIDLLMATAKIVLNKTPNLTWKVIGYGEQEEKLKEFIAKENLSQQLILQPAAEQEITGEYDRASLFVMTSRNECFPLVLLEAMRSGIPCIAFDCETGPRHIIRQNQTGLLIEKENSQKMAEAIIHLIADKERRNEMSNNALEVIQQYSPNRVYELWEKLF